MQNGSNMERNDSLNEDEKIILQLIEQTGCQGISINELKRRSNLQKKYVHQVLEELQRIQLVKKVLSRAFHHQELYMLYNVEPSAAITGGEWYKENAEQWEWHKWSSQSSVDVSTCPVRKVAFKVAYCGWNYSGMAYQDADLPTVELALFSAFLKCKLIASRTSCDFSRCGRTDKGVSASGQVIALRIRTASQESLPLADDFPFIQMLNESLPNDIRILAACAVPLDFHARHACTSRTYCYALPMQPTWSLWRLDEALECYVGMHDFRNFAKLDLKTLKGSVKKREEVTRREILAVGTRLNATGNVCFVTLKGESFLYHQVRNMIAVVCMILNGEEAMTILPQLLDPDEVSAKPIYEPASPEPLTLSACGYGNEHNELPWEVTMKVTSSAIGPMGVGKMMDSDSLQGLRTMQHTLSCRLSFLQNLLESQDTVAVDQANMTASPSPSPLVKRHVALMERRRELPLEHHWKKQKTASATATGKG